MTNNSVQRTRGRPPRADQRHVIVEAAYAVLAERGREAATIKEIARTAGVAPGLVHYYFASKEELLVAVLRAASERYTSEMARLATTAPSAALPALALDVPRTRVAHQPAWYRLRYDVFALGLRDAALQTGVAALLANGRAGIAAAVRLALPAAGFPAGIDADALGALLLACFDGLALQRLIDPAFDLDSAYAALGKLLGIDAHIWSDDQPGKEAHL